MNDHRESMLTVIFAILICVISQCSITNAVTYDRFCQHYPPLSQYHSEPHSGSFSFFVLKNSFLLTEHSFFIKRTNYDFIRFGRGRKDGPGTYDYIRFGKRLSGLLANQNSEQTNLAK
uniref:Bm4823, isoform a n=1 Tax=Brugia malayi TaxID=6279 RepID=A0A1I9G6Y2_BRUMA|nr:Bm4823, isoform a [Brugia malayi]